MGLGFLGFREFRSLELVGFRSLECIGFKGLLGGSWVVISGVTSRVTASITHIRGLITSLITTHEPPSIVPLRD